MKQISIVCLFVLALSTFNSCDRNTVTPDPTAWIEKLDTSVSALQKTQLRAWITEGLSAVKMDSASKLYAKGSDFFQALNTSKSIYHRRVLIDDEVAAIPGISLGAYTANGLPRTLIAANPANANLDLPATEAPNFTDAKDTVLAQGKKIYRVIGGSGSFSTGSYWVETKPTTYAEIIGGTAVQPEWNGFNVIVEYTVPAAGMKVWKGKAAKQAIAGTTNKFITSYLQKYNLAGAGVQLYVPNVYRDYRDTAVYNAFLRNITKQDSILWIKK